MTIRTDWAALSGRKTCRKPRTLRFSFNAAPHGSTSTAQSNRTRRSAGSKARVSVLSSGKRACLRTQMLRSCGRDREERRGLQRSLRPKAGNAAKNSMRRRTSFCARAVKSLVEAPCMMDGRGVRMRRSTRVKGVGFSIELGKEALFENRTSCGPEMRRGSPCSCGRGDDWKPPEHVLSGLRVSRICNGGRISRVDRRRNDAILLSRAVP